MTARQALKTTLLLGLLIAGCMKLSNPYELGNRFLELEDYGKAISYYRVALDKDSTDNRARNNLGVAYLRSREYDQAFKEFQKVIATDPDNPKAHFNLALVYYARGLHEQEIQEYQNTIRLDLAHFAAHLNLGHAYLAQGQDDLAQKEYEWVLEKEPHNAQATYNLAMIHMEHQRKQEAAMLLDRYLKLDSKSPWADKVRKHLETLKGRPAHTSP